jgi:hypothetical protein
MTPEQQQEYDQQIGDAAAYAAWEAEQAAKPPTESELVAKLSQQIRQQGTLDKWSTGRGLSTDTAIEHMAGKLYSQGGIKDIKDFGKIPVTQPAIPVAWTFDGKPVINNPGHGMLVGTGEMINEGWDSEAGAYSMRERQRYLSPEEQGKLTVTHYGYNGVDEDGNRGTVGYIPASQVKNINGSPRIETGETAYGNKVTGQVIPTEYDRAGGNIWSGTFVGDGSTGYGVQFDAQGNPYFYTQYGGSTNDFANLMSNPVINFVANAAAAMTGGPIAVAALQGANAIANGKDLGDAITAAAKGAATAYVGGQIAGGVSGNLTDTLGTTGANLAGKVVASEIMSGGKADLSKLLTNAALSSGIGAVTNTGPSSADMVEGYFAPGGEGYIPPENPAELTQPPVDYSAIDQQTQDLLNALSGGADSGTATNQDQAEWDVPVSPVDLKTALEDLPQEQAEWDVPVNPDDLNKTLTEIASPDQTDKPSPNEKDVLEFIKEHPEDVKTSPQTLPKTPITPAPTPAPTPRPTPAPTTKPAPQAAAAPQGYMPGVGDVARIKWENGLFGILPWEEQPAASAEDKQSKKTSEENSDDVLTALENSQYATGGHVDDFSVEALLQILRS